MATDLTTYDGLQAAIADFIARADLTGQIPGFIRLAEAKFARALRTIEMQRTVPLTTGADGTVPVPADFLEARGAFTLGYLGLALPFLPADLAAIRNSVDGGPVTYAYSLANGVITLVPGSPAVPLNFTYTAKFMPLSEASQTNWLLNDHPDAYFYGALSEYYLFNQDDDPANVMKYGGMAAAIIADVQAQDRRRRFGAGVVLPPVCAP